MWSLWRKKKGKEEPEEDKADLALAEATRNLHAARQRSQEVTQITNALKRINERNHFGETLEALIVQHRGPLNDT